MPQKRRKGTTPPIWASQNFLTSYKTINRIIRRTTLNKNDHVIEIGPGKGHTTGILIQKCRQVSAIEIDERLYNKLMIKFKSTKNIRIYHQDFLKWKLPESEDYKVFSNIPFCFTTDIVRKLTECKNVPSETWLIMEKGAAKRFMGKPSESLRSLLIKPKFDLDIVYYFDREDFHPKPGVDAVLLHFKKKSQPDISANQWFAYEQFASKGLKYGLRSLFTRKQLSRALRQAGVQNGVTPAEILYVQWLCLFRCYWEHVLGKK
ncbi:23S ribosomal RNA methyltransferase Erm [Clostridium thermosuccinogenes]|uniref:23S ribosomal RNA methyltransferase Erm n=1 Tax=Clostridium thermosuccinogenes TaxID=84032 RepID=UPI000CCBE9DD|nr:23S ribosomal RNA methyltransferase Erm [Pseudoclostridium thermosuccinogenes]PNT92165.1 dimethyladenosine transferase [Pseudoclostridium thermosuccinogenes]